MSKNILNGVLKKHLKTIVNINDIWDEYWNLCSIEQSISKLNEERYALNIEHENKIKVNKAKIKELQELCNHLDIVYNPDRSGNNDSYDTCNICGKEI